MTKPRTKKSNKSDQMLDAERFQNWLISFRKQNKLRLREISELTGIPYRSLIDDREWTSEEPFVAILHCVRPRIGLRTPLGFYR